MMKYLTFLFVILLFVSAQAQTDANEVMVGQIKRIHLDSTCIRVIWFAFPPASGYSWVSPDTSASYNKGQTAVINPPDGTRWNGNASISWWGTAPTAEESDSLTMWVKPLDYDGVAFMNDSCFLSMTADPPEWVSTDPGDYNWTTSTRYHCSLTGYLPLGCFGCAVYLDQKAANTTDADSFIFIKLDTY